MTARRGATRSHQPHVRLLNQISEVPRTGPQGSAIAAPYCHTRPVHHSAPPALPHSFSQYPSSPSSSAPTSSRVRRKWYRRSLFLECSSETASMSEQTSQEERIISRKASRGTATTSHRSEQHVTVVLSGFRDRHACREQGGGSQPYSRSASDLATASRDAVPRGCASLWRQA